MATELERRTMTDARVDSAAMDEGLRAYMLRVYNYMASGLLLSGIIAMAVAETELRNLFYLSDEAGRMVGYSGLGMISMFLPLGLIFFMSFTWQKRSAGTMQILYWVFVGTMGIGLSTILMAYTGKRRPHLRNHRRRVRRVELGWLHHKEKPVRLRHVLSDGSDRIDPCHDRQHDLAVNCNGLCHTSRGRADLCGPDGL